MPGGLTRFVPADNLVAWKFRQIRRCRDDPKGGATTSFVRFATNARNRGGDGLPRSFVWTRFVDVLNYPKYQTLSDFLYNRLSGFLYRNVDTVLPNTGVQTPSSLEKHRIIKYIPSYLLGFSIPGLGNTAVSGFFTNVSKLASLCTDSARRLARNYLLNNALTWHPGLLARILL